MIRYLRGAFRLFVVCVILYICWGVYSSTFYQSISDQRTAYAVHSTGDVEIGVTWADDPRHTYQTGVEVGIAEVNGRGITMPDGTVRRLKPIFVDGNPFTASPEDFGRSLTTLISSNPRMVATLVGVPPRMTNKTSIVCDAYGVALLLSSPHDARQSLLSFQNMVSIIPTMSAFSRKVNSNLESVVAPTGDPQKPLRVGVLFDASPADASVTIHSYLQNFEEVSSIINSANLLHQSVAKGDLHGKLTLGQLIENPYLQAAVSSRLGNIDTLIDSVPEAKTTTLEDVLAKLKTPRRPLELAFVRYYTDTPTSYAPLVSLVGEYKPDVIVLLGNKSSLELLKEKRRDHIPVPIVTFELRSPEFYKESLGESVEGLVVVSIVDPDAADSDFQDFKKRFEIQMEAEHRGSKSVDDLAVAGYESVLMLERSLKSGGSSAPGSIINCIKYPSQPWKLAGQTLKFNSNGIPIQRETYLLKYTDGQFKVVKPNP